MTDNNAPPCSWKLHAFRCGCAYITSCKCHATPKDPTEEYGRCNKDTVKRTNMAHACRDCQLQALDQPVEKATEWQDLMLSEYCRYDHPHPDMVSANRDLQKAEDKRDRMTSSIEATMFDYGKFWTKLPRQWWPCGRS